MNDTQCSVEGCDHKPKARDLCRVHYERVLRSGRTDLPPHPSPPERLAGGVVRMPSGCLEWTGALAYGYGRISVDGKWISTHRFAWELANGSIPDGLWVLHRCDNPPCCNVEHLFLGTAADNTADMIAKGRSHQGDWQRAKTQCKHGHPFDEANTYVDPAGKRKCRKCGAKIQRLKRLTAQQQNNLNLELTP